MTCEFCGGETSPRKVKRQHWLKGKSVLSVESGISTQRFLMTLIVFWRPIML